MAGYSLLLESLDSSTTPRPTHSVVGDDLPGSPRHLGDSPNRAGPSGLARAMRGPDVADDPGLSEEADESSYVIAPVRSKSASTAKGKSLKRRPPVDPSTRSTRSQTKRAAELDAVAISGMSKVQATVEAMSQRTTFQETDRDESLPEVLASFGPADLVRGGVAGIQAFDDENPVGDQQANQENDGVAISTNAQVTPGASNASAEVQQASGSFSSILTPFSHFFGSRSAPPAASPSAAQDEAESSLDPLSLQPQTSSTPIG